MTTAASIGPLAAQVVHCVRNILDLKALSVATTRCVSLLGYFEAGDRGGGTFYWDSSATEADNEGTIIVSLSNPHQGRWKRVIEGPISVRWFGAMADGSNAYDRIGRAIAVAIKERNALHFPAGTYAVTLPTDRGPYNGWNVTGNLLITGEGAATTKIKVTNFAYPDGQSGGICFQLCSNCDLELRNLALEGPDERPPFSAATSGYPLGIYGTDNNQITLRCVRSTQLASIIKHAVGDPPPQCSLTATTSRLPGRVHIYDSVLSHRGVGVLMIEDNDSTAGELIFHDSSISQDPDGWTALEDPTGWHNLYIHPTISIDIDGCEFLGAPQNGYGIQNYRADLGGGSVPPRFCRIQNTYFSGDVWKPVLTNKLASCQIVDCTFEGGKRQVHTISVNGDVAIIGCSFRGGGGDVLASYAIYDGLFRAGNVLVQGCRFQNDGTLTNLNDIRRQKDDPSKTWVIQDCDFNSTRPDGTNVFLTAGRVTIEDCRFFSTSGVACVRMAGGNLTIRNSQFYEAGLDHGPLLIEEDQGNATVELNDNTFSSPDYMTINRNGVNDIHIAGSGNTSHNGWSIINDDVAHVSGNFLPKREIGSYRCTQDPTNPNDIDLHLNWNGDTFEIDEAPAPIVSNVYFDGQTGGAHNNAFTSAMVRLRAVQPFMLARGGNVVADSALVNIDDVVTLQYFPRSSEWLEVARR